LHLFHMALQFVEELQLLFGVFAALTPQDHPEDSPGIAGKYSGHQLLEDPTFERVSELPVFRLAGLYPLVVTQG
jgi:hypothetical protein